MKNKILAFVLTICMVAGTVTAVPTTLYAASDYSSNRAVMFLTKLDIMKEDIYTGEFWDDSYVKRFEIAQILCNLFGYEAKADGEKLFNDVGEEDRAYVETVVRNGLMAGYGNGKFGPNDYVTYEQIVKIFVDVIGGKDYATMLGGFPMGYLKAAKRLGIGSEASGRVNQIARRIDVAQIIYDALHVDLIQMEGIYEDYVNYGIIDGETLLTETLNIYTVKGRVSAIDSTSLNRATGGTDDAAVKIGDEVILDPEYMADYYFGSDVVAYAKKNPATDVKTLIYIEESYQNSIIEIRGSELGNVTSKQITYYDGNRTRNAKISAITDMVYNGRAIAFDKAKLKKSSDVAVKMVDSNGDGIIDFVSVNEYKNVVIDRYNADSETIYLQYGESPVKLKDCYIRVFSDGNAITPEELESGMVASVAVSEDLKAVLIECSTTAVLGSIESITTKSGVDYIIIEGKEYRVSTAAKTLVANNRLPEIKAGVSGQFYLNTNNELVYFTGGGTSGTIGYFVATDVENQSFSTSVQFKIYTDKGKMEIFSAKDKIRINDKSIKLSNLASDPVWIDFCNETMGKQLIKYKAVDGVIKEITYCSNTPQYDAQNFSLDVKDSLYVQKQYVLGYTYSVDGETKVFYVPNDGSDDVSKYRVLTGTYFRRDKTYDVSLYDLTPQGKVTYAIVRSTGSSVLTVDNGFVYVTEVMKGINSDGDEVNVIEGYNTAGKLIELQSMPGEALCDSADSTRIVEKGDVIQYATNALGSLEEIKVVQKVSDTEHKGIGNVHNNDRQISFGYAANVSESSLLVTETKYESQISPLIAKAVVASGGLVVIYNRAREAIEVASFADIVSGDEIFALCNASNTTMMIVIYR